MKSSVIILFSESVNGLEIELDDLDWEMFDREVTLTPTIITDGTLDVYQ